MKPLDRPIGTTSRWPKESYRWNAVLGPLLLLSVALNVHQQQTIQELATQSLAEGGCCSCCDLYERFEFSVVVRQAVSGQATRRGKRHATTSVTNFPAAAPRHLNSTLYGRPDNANSSLSIDRIRRSYTSLNYSSIAPRVLASSSSSSSSSAGSAEHEDHQSDAMLFLFNALVIGAAVMQLAANFPILQNTVLLFVLGVIMALVMSGIGIKDDVGVWGTSYTMWIDIDPHLFMFTLLPALLAGDAMSIDTSVAKRVAYQCLYLAGPGVLISAMLTALFLQGFLQWSFLLSLVAGSILCATDPVAVVALLKELGASPVLTVQIQGESLLNDGTAIVLYMISYNMLSGENYDFADIAMFLVKKAMMAWALGLFIGYAFFSWIRAAGDRLSHGSGIIQISLTLCCAYWSFIIVEGVLHLSGVLAVVASSLVLAHHMWPHIVAQESLHHVWHTFESLGNIIVFFLAGVLTGEIILKTDAVDFVNLVVIYVFLMLLRCLLMFLSMPILNRVGDDNVSPADAALMAWGGLRGAVGLVLAIQVHNELAPNADGEQQISQTDGRRLLFFVSGIAFLTMVVNAVTAPLLVQQLGIIALPHARQQLLKMFHRQLVNWSEDASNPKDVTESLKQMLHEAETEIDHQRIKSDGPQCHRVEGLRGSLVRTKLTDGSRSKQSTVFAISEVDDETFQSNKDLIDEFLSRRVEHSKIPEANLRYVLSRLPETRDLCSEDYVDMVSLITEQWVDIGMAKVVNTTLLNLVLHNYWKLIEAGDLRPGSKESDMLLTSIRVSLSSYSCDLGDFKIVKTLLEQEISAQSLVKSSSLYDSDFEGGFHIRFHAQVVRLVRSSCFNIFIATAIFFNSIQVAVEEAARNEKNDGHKIWLVLDAIFTAIFVFEFLVKFFATGCKYFASHWNRFDFLLALLGVFGLTMSIIVASSDGDAGSQITGEARIIRVARVLRTLRFLRVFRLFHARLSADKYVSVELANHMVKLQTWTSFAQAHLMGQEDMIKYFGGNGKLDTIEEAELARCILQSQVGVYKAIKEVVSTQLVLQEPLLDELFSVTERKSITENLERFVLDAHRHGALSSREAHTILHHLHHQINACLSLIYERSEGLIDSKMAARMKETNESHEIAVIRTDRRTESGGRNRFGHRPTVSPVGSPSPDLQRGPDYESPVSKVATWHRSEQSMPDCIEAEGQSSLPLPTSSMTPRSVIFEDDVENGHGDRFSHVLPVASNFSSGNGASAFNPRGSTPSEALTELSIHAPSEALGSVIDQASLDDGKFKHEASLDESRFKHENSYPQIRGTFYNSVNNSVGSGGGSSIVHAATLPNAWESDHDLGKKISVATLPNACESDHDLSKTLSVATLPSARESDNVLGKALSLASVSDSESDLGRTLSLPKTLDGDSTIGKQLLASTLR